MTLSDQVARAQELADRKPAPQQYEFIMRITLSSERMLTRLYALLDELEGVTDAEFTTSDVVRYGKWFGVWGDGGLSLKVTFSGSHELGEYVKKRVWRRLGL